MAFWNRWKKAELSDEELRERIFAGLIANDDKVLALIQQHQARIRERFSSWTTIPDPIWEDRKARDTYAHGLITLAQIFERAGDGSLLSALTAPQQNDPISRLRETFIEGQKAADDDRFEDAIRILEPLVAELRTLRGSFVDQCLCRACGTLGVAMLRTDRHDEALRWTQAAIDAAAAADDQEGVETYTKTLRSSATGRFNRYRQIKSASMSGMQFHRMSSLSAMGSTSSCATPRICSDLTPRRKRFATRT